MPAPGDPDYNPVNDPMLKGAAAAFHHLIACARRCAEAARHDDIAARSGHVATDALDQLNRSLETRALREVYAAAMDFQLVFPPDGPLLELVRFAAEGDDNQLAMIEAVTQLREAITGFNTATGQLQQRFPTADGGEDGAGADGQD
jgi:hypothetical protein